MTRWKTAALAIALACGSSGALAQSVRTASPEAMVEAMSRAMAAGDWTAAAASFDPQALKDFRALLMPVLERLPADQAEAMAASVFSRQSVARLRNGSDAEFFAAFMAGMMAMGGGRLEASQVIGSVAEGSDLRHVVVRNRASASGLSMTKMEVVSVRRTPEGWRVLLKGEMKGLAEAMVRRLGQPGGGH